MLTKLKRGAKKKKTFKTLFKDQEIVETHQQSVQSDGVRQWLTALIDCLAMEAVAN